jgi:NADH-quinone oxidoreductase subunit F
LDLHPIAAEPSGDERAAIDGVLGAAEGAAPARRRDLLLPALHAAQGRVGWLSPGALGYACRRLDVPPAEGYGVASFYSLFSLTRRPPTVVHVCDDLACLAGGAGAVLEAVERSLGPAGTPTPDGRFTWHRSPCLGQCERAPAALFVAAGPEPVETAMAPASARQIVASATAAPGGPGPAPIPQRGDGGDASGLRLLRRVGVVDPTSLDDYRAHGGYRALRRALELGPAGVLREVLESKLLGRGGAAFPTGRKWEAVARSTVRPRYLVCNADESEPGTFKDRVILEEDPFVVLEAMTIAGFATGCEQGFLYVRGEYPRAARRIEGAIAQARARGLLGADIGSRGVRFDVEVRRGAGAYICGEETALFNSIEGRRGEPRNKPPFPVEVGLFGRPTVINNVETLANVPLVLLEGGPAYAKIGTADSTGTRLFCLSGHVARPGLYEIPMGTTLRALLDLGGGVANGRALRAVLLGGAAGSFATPDELDVPLSFEGTRAAGLTMGSGVVLVLDDTADLEAILLRTAAFFRDESCGQCVPCRVGTVRQQEALSRIAARRTLGSVDDERALLAAIGRVMRDASICGLGQTASAAIESAFAKLGPFGTRSSR